MISDHEYETSMSILSSAFPDRKIDKNILRSYNAGLVDLPNGYLYLAVQEVIKSAKFFPRISEIREVYERIWQMHGRVPMSYDGEIFDHLEKTVGKDKQLWNQKVEVK